MNENTRVTQDKKKPYTAPSLKCYGELRALTQAGSGGLMEGMAMMSLVRRA